MKKLFAWYDENWWETALEDKEFYEWNKCLKEGGHYDGDGNHETLKLCNEKLNLGQFTKE